METNNIEFKFHLPNFFVIANGKILLIPSMVLSTIFTCFFITFVPQLMPLWMVLATNSRL